MNRAFLAPLLLMAQLLHATPLLNVIEKSDQFPETLEEMVDDFTYVYFKRVMDNPSAIDGQSYKKTATGWEVQAFLIADLSQLSPERRDPLLTWLRRIYVNGEPWRGITFKLNPGKVGVATDPTRPFEEILKVVESFEWEQGERALDSICDIWLTKPH